MIGLCGLVVLLCRFGGVHAVGLLVDADVDNLCKFDNMFVLHFDDWKLAELLQLGVALVQANKPKGY